MSEQRIPTTQRLADALRQAGAPAEMIAKAEAGAYDDFKSQSATPIVDLVNDCLAAGLSDLAVRAMDEEFDAPAWESEEWATNTPEGRAVMQEFFGGVSQPRQGSAKMKFKQPKKR